MKTIDISWRRYILPNINNEGWRFVGIFAAVTALLAILWQPLGWIGLVLTIWCFYFFRDPERVTPDVENVVVSPADGIVQMITKVKAPEELGLGDKKFTRVSVFMSVFNVHVNRAPAGGLGVNGNKTRLRKKRAQQIAGIAAIRQVIDNKGMFINRTNPGSGKLKAFGGAPDVAVISRHIDNRSIADIQLIGKDAGRQQAAAADGYNFVIVSGIFDFSAEFPGIAMKLFPGYMEFFSHGSPFSYVRPLFCKDIRQPRRCPTPRNRAGGRFPCRLC